MLSQADRTERLAKTGCLDASTIPITPYQRFELTQQVKITDNPTTQRNRQAVGMTQDAILVVELDNQYLEREQDPTSPSNGRIVLPADITAFIDDPKYNNRARFVAELYGISALRDTLKIAKKRANKTDENGRRKVSHYFARMISVKCWKSHTVANLNTARELMQKIKEVIKGVGAGAGFAPLLHGNNRGLVCKFVLKGNGLDGLTSLLLTAKTKKHPFRYAKACMNNAVYGRQTEPAN